MLHERTELPIDYAGYGLDMPKTPASLTSYVLARPADMYLHRGRAAVIICPGGGYGFVYPGEGEPVALAFNGLGIHTFVLQYSVAPMHFPGALLELSAAVAFVRRHAEEYQIDPNRIAVCGFSAGGHLAATLGVYWKEAFIQRFLQLDEDENQPNGLLLCYPVITSEESDVNRGSLVNLLGRHPDEREIDLFAVERHVSDFTPPTFLWHTSDDPDVSVGNSLRFTSALSQRKIPFELHVFPHGGHGLSLANDVTAATLEQINPSCQEWLGMAARFVENL